MDFKNLLATKKSSELSEEQIQEFVNAVKNKELSDKQILEFVKVSAQTGCTNNEVYYMAKYMALSGEMLNLGTDLGFCVDKHSAGSVSDGMSLILMSVLASLGLKFVRVVSNTYGTHGNLLQKLSKFKGFSAFLTKQEMYNKANWCGVGILQDQGDIAPVAAKMYKVCKENNLMVEPVVSASIMANKIATGANLLIVDVKSGEGSVVGTNNAVALADRLVAVGTMANIKTVAVVTDFNWPISASVGVGLELQEIKDTLSNAKEYIGSNILKLAKEMVTCVLIASNKVTGRSQASEMFENAINSGMAYNKLCEIIETYGGDIHSVDRTDKLLDTAVSYITADYDGYVGDIMLDKLYSSTNFIISNKGEYDADAGLVLMCAEGDRVVAGQKLAKVFYSHNNNRYFKVAEDLYKSFKITKEKPVHTNLFVKVVV